MSDASQTTCPHCGGQLTPLEIPEALFEHAHDLACFSDECPYYLRGWAWMEQHYGVRASYRYRVDAQTGQASPLVVRSLRPPEGAGVSAASPGGDGGRS